MAFTCRFPWTECVTLGKALTSAVKTHAPEDASLEHITTDLALIAHTLEENHRPEVEMLNRLDFQRDQLVLALYFGLKTWTHRVDTPRLRESAHTLLKRLFVDGTGWIDAPNQEETTRLDTLLTDLRATDTVLGELGLLSCAQALQDAQREFLAVEGEHELSTDGGAGLVVSVRILLNSFHRKLELYVATVRESSPDDGPRSRALLEPLTEAAARLHAPNSTVQ